jgi:hypothetical protein
MAASAGRRSCGTSRQGSVTRDSCSERAVGMHPGFAIYRTRATNQRIPVLRLYPV